MRLEARDTSLGSIDKTTKHLATVTLNSILSELSYFPDLGQVSLSNFSIIKPNIDMKSAYSLAAWYHPFVCQSPISLLILDKRTGEDCGKPAAKAQVSENSGHIKIFDSLATSQTLVVKLHLLKKEELPPIIYQSSRTDPKNILFSGFIGPMADGEHVVIMILSDTRTYLTTACLPSGWQKLIRGSKLMDIKETEAASKYHENTFISFLEGLQLYPQKVESPDRQISLFLVTPQIPEEYVPLFGLINSFSDPIPVIVANLRRDVPPEKALLQITGYARTQLPVPYLRFNLEFPYPSFKKTNYAKAPKPSLRKTFSLEIVGRQGEFLLANPTASYVEARPAKGIKIGINPKSGKQNGILILMYGKRLRVSNFEATDEQLAELFQNS